MNKQEFKQLVAAIKSAFPNFNVDSKGLSIWYDNLADLDYKVAAVAVKKIMQVSEYPPTIATIRKHYSAVLGREPASTEDVLSLMNTVVSRFGRYQVEKGMEWIKEQSETAYRILKAIGYQNYCNADPNFASGLVSKMTREMARQTEESLAIERKFANEIRQMQSNGLKMLSMDY